MNETQADVVIIGAGAAGLMCALEAGKRGRRVLVLEHHERVGKKILISGGGRCNFTNRQAGPDAYLSSQPGFCKSALSRFGSADFIQLVEKHGIAYHEKKLGQLFCNQSSRDIVDLLLKECQEARVEIRTGCRILNVEKNLQFELRLKEEIVRSDSLVVATGGLSFPKLGASDLGYRLARQFRLKVIEPRPGLVPLEFHHFSDFTSLSGVSLDAEVRCDKKGFRENLLFTHRGLSGPAILQISSYWSEGRELEVDLLPGRKLTDLLTGESKARSVEEILVFHLPKRFVSQFCKDPRFQVPLGNLKKEEVQELSRFLHQWKLSPAGTEGFEKAEVTLGGVSPADLHSKTMEARSQYGLYFIGEVVDVTGWLGGFNFQWAWSSGFTAGQYV